MRLIKYIIVAIVIPIAISLVIGELYLRQIWVNYFLSDRYIFLKEHVPNQQLIYNRQKYGYPDTEIKINSDGCIMPDFIDKGTKSVITLAFLGGSVTECAYVYQTLRFPYLLSEYISNYAKSSVKIINTSSSAANMHEAVNLYFNKVMKYRPDYVFIMHVFNDAALFEEKKDYEIFTIRNKHERFIDILSRSYLFAFFRHLRGVKILDKERMRAWGNSINQKRDEEIVLTGSENNPSVNEYAARVRIIIDMVKDSGAEPIMITEAFLGRVYEGKGKYILDVFNDELRKICAQKGCLLIDLDKLMPDNKKYFYDNIHFTDEGSEAAAKILFEEWKRLIQKK